MELSGLDSKLVIAIGILNLIFSGGILGFLLKINYKWNTLLDRVDLLYKEYCDAHEIPFKGLKNDFE